MPGFAYGDSVKTGDDKYVLAQFRHDAILTSVGELRSLLDLEELKWRDYRNRREYVLSNRELSQRVRNGLEQAELTIIDLPMYRRITLSDLIDQGAEAGHDYRPDYSQRSNRQEDDFGESARQAFSPRGLSRGPSFYIF